MLNSRAKKMCVCFCCEFKTREDLTINTISKVQINYTSYMYAIHVQKNIYNTYNKSFIQQVSLVTLPPMHTYKIN